MPDLSGWLTILNLFVLVAGTFGGIFAFRSSMANAERAVQSRIIAAMKEEREGLNRKIEEIQEENKRLDRILETLVDLLKSREIYITVQGHTISIKEGKETIVTRISDESPK